MCIYILYKNQLVGYSGASNEDKIINYTLNFVAEVTDEVDELMKFTVLMLTNIPSKKRITINFPLKRIRHVSFWPGSRR